MAYQNGKVLKWHSLKNLKIVVLFQLYLPTYEISPTISVRNRPKLLTFIFLCIVEAQIMDALIIMTTIDTRAIIYFFFFLKIKETRL